jgi:glycosyltransferase involved in cell wall biosynthesis
MKVVIIGTIASSILCFRSDLISKMIENNISVYAFAIDYDEKSRDAVKNLGAIPVDYEFNRAGLNPVSDMIGTLKLARKLRAINPDLVFSYFVKPVIFGTLAARLAGIKRRIGMIEGLGFSFTEQPYGESGKLKLIRRAQIFLYKLMLPSLERVIFLNRDDPLDLLEANKIRVKKVSVLGGIGVNLSQYPYTEPKTDKVSFIFIARLLAEKGIHDYISAAKIVKKSYPHTEFVVLGGIDEDAPGALGKQELNQLIEQKIITYPGHVTNVAEWITKAGVFVLPSYYREGVPRSIQEAMAIGRPIITTDMPGCRETVKNSINGFLVAKWSPDVIAEKMIFFIENPGAINTMGKESHLMAREAFDADKVCDKLLGYFRNPLND